MDRDNRSILAVPSLETASLQKILNVEKKYLIAGQKPQQYQGEFPKIGSNKFQRTGEMIVNCFFR